MQLSSFCLVLVQGLEKGKLNNNIIRSLVSAYSSIPGTWQ